MVNVHIDTCVGEWRGYRFRASESTQPKSLDEKLFGERFANETVGSGECNDISIYIGGGLWMSWAASDGCRVE
jgi:hypothetical protein